ncbi:hypothetical protein [Streptomyces sp. NPDC058612]|uniref:hypothetical protein n=1 Tax=Streptomyces sp. NPDC058612 TaxID=3346555 RepID=UPI003651A02A
MRFRTRKTLTVTLGATAALLLTASPSSAAGQPWSASHQTATANGHRSLEKGSSILTSTLAVEGELRNTGPECYSLWSLSVHDFAPMPARKVATQCGPGTTAVSFKTHYAPTTTSSVYICAGEGATDCGPRVSLTTWRPQKAPAPAAAP